MHRHSTSTLINSRQGRRQWREPNREIHRTPPPLTLATSDKEHYDCNCLVLPKELQGLDELFVMLAPVDVDGRSKCLRSDLERATRLGTTCTMLVPLPLKSVSSAFVTLTSRKCPPHFHGTQGVWLYDNLKVTDAISVSNYLVISRYRMDNAARNPRSKLRM